MQLNEKNILVTGGAGFIGSHVVELLVGKGANVTVVDNLVTGNLANLEQVKDRIRMESIDILDEANIRRVMQGQQIVFHFAANADVPRSVDDPAYDFENNIIGSYRLLTSALDVHAEKFIFASSAAVYGNPVYTPIDEKHPTDPLSPYGASKLAIEILGRSYFRTFGLPFVTMRIFNTFGPRQPRYVMYDLFRKLYKDPSSLEVMGTGDQLRDYSYVADTANAFVLAAERAEGGTIYNIAGGKPTSIRTVVTHILDILGLSGVPVRFTNKSWKGDINVLSADISNISRDLGFRPTVDLVTGLKALHEYLSKYKTS